MKWYNRISAYLLLGFLLLIYGTSHAQTDFQPGYVITAPGDTLFGEVDHRANERMGQVCRFRPSQAVKATQYYPQEIVGYRIENGKYFAAKKVEGKHEFLECLIDGKVSIYYLRKHNENRFFIEKAEYGLQELPYYEETRYQNGEGYIYESVIHKRILNKYMQDVPTMQAKVRWVQRPRRKNLVRLVEAYHDLAGKEAGYTIYEQESPFFEIDLELAGGFTNYENLDNLRDLYYPIGGILAYMRTPKLPKNLYVRTGLFYSIINSEPVYGGILKLPLQMIYSYPGDLLQPKIGTGINLYWPFFHTVAFTGGTNFKITERFSGSLTYDIAFYANTDMPIFPQAFFSHTFLVGVYWDI